MESRMRTKKYTSVDAVDDNWIKSMPHNVERLTMTCESRGIWLC